LNLSKQPRVIKVSNPHFPEDAAVFETDFSELAKSCETVYETQNEFFGLGERGEILRAFKGTMDLTGLVVPVKNIQINPDVASCVVTLDFSWLSFLAIKLQGTILRNEGDGYYYLISSGTVFRAKQSEEMK